MFKGLISEVAKDAGRSAALIINQLFQWYKGNNSKKIYRTNQELHDDLCGIMSTATIQRCKKRLIEKGYIEVSFDKGLNRVTHYSLTKKALDLLDCSKTSSEARSETKEGKGSAVPSTSKTTPKRAKTSVKKSVPNNPYGNVKSMQKCFEEGSDNKNADRSLTLSERLALMKGEKIDLNKPNEALEQCLDKSCTNVPDNTKTVSTELTDDLNEMCNGNEEDEYLNNLSQQDYDECDLAMLNDLNKQQEHLTDDKLTVGQLLGNIGSVYKSGVSEARERIYRMTQLQSSYLEDY
ncbi:TPA: hypothetical protein NNW70_004187 [Salmonella enterica]|nr:hypothetical protein [Salmonella enterica]HCH9607897.1 hypothetical protein [Salmonella enterica]HDI5000191.1 hypothetical protein [Salmonella enterica]